jgi:hypothetical protein
MKTLLTISTLVFAVMFSTPSYSEWRKVAKNKSGDTFYVDFERIRKHGGYVYFWVMEDYLKRRKGSYGHISMKKYHQVDCKLFRYKGLSWSFHKEPMGGGTGEPDNTPDKEWTYPPPNSVNEHILKIICSR